MKNWLEEYVEQHREALDDRPAPPGNRARFEEKLNQRYGRERVLIIPMRRLARVAAAVLVLAATGFWFLKDTNLNAPLVTSSPIYEEMATHYSFQEQMIRQDFEGVALKDYEFVTQLEEDLDELEEENKAFRQLLQEEGPNDFLIESMTQNFEMRLMLLEKMQTLINASKNETENPVNL